ncbi:RING-H2 finger protein ATL80-like [Impatiens glandulifera]|uniref:RING-H2 finger protein ATL80-like n=1 Tax=Impatiens glandulifera TaxID=253017 RepID=UPI001FB0C365|nr:RING-H2 finger protein ATL80-like [Impatiens glandulifera]
MTLLRQLNYSSSSSSPKSSLAEPPEPVVREADLVVILAALLCAVISVAGLIAVVRCAWLRHGASGGGRRPSASPNKGLKKKIVQSLPKFTYDRESSNERMCANTECAVCLSEYVDGDEIRVLPQCGHGFHVACIDTWLGSHSSCPSCRQVLVVTRCRKCGDRR